MTRKKTIERCCDLADQLVRTEVYSLRDEIYELVFRWNRNHHDDEIFVLEADDYIMIEDERFDFYRA